MANTVVGFSLKLDGTDSINQLTAAIKETKDSMKDLDRTTEEYANKAKRLGEAEAELKAVKKQQDDVNKSFLESSSALRPYDQLSAKLNRLRKDYKDLVVSGQQFTEEAQNLLKEITDLDTELKDVDATVGQFQRNVGNYPKTDLSGLISQLDKLQKEYNDLSDAQKESSEEAKNLKTQIDLLDNEVKSITSSYDKLNAENNELKKQYKDLALQNKLNTAEAKALKAQIDELDATLKKADDTLKDTNKNSISFGDSISGVGDSFGSFGGFASQAVGGVRALGAAFQAALGPIGLIIAAIGLVVTSVKAFFTSSEEGQNKFRKLQAIATVVFNNLRDIFASLGELIVGVFEKPVESIKALGNFIVQNIINRFVGLLELIPKLAKAMSEVFAGDFAKAGQTATDALAKLTIGVADFTDKAKKGFNVVNNLMTDLAKNTQSEIDRQIKLSNLQDNLDKRAREILVQNALLEQKIADNRNKFAQKDKFNNEERLKFLEDAIKQENQILKNNEFLAATRLRIAREENSINSNKGKKTKEMLLQEAELEADLIRLKTDNLNKTKELEAQQVEALNAIKAEQDKATTDEKKRLEELDKTRKKLLEDDVKFTEAAAKLNADIVSKTNKLVTDLIQDEFMKRRQAANENFANEVRLTEEQIALRKKENEKRLTDAEKTLGVESDEFKKIRQEIIDEEAQLTESANQYRIEREKQLVNDLAKIKGDEVKATLDAEEAKRKAIEETNEKLQKSTDDYYGELNKKIQQAGELLQIGLDTLDGFLDASDERRLKRLEKDEEANQQIQDNLNERLQRASGLERRFLEQQLQANKQNAENLAKQKEKIEKESAKRKKATAIIESVINTALAVSSALATPPAPNIVAALIAGIAGAAQTAVIAAQPLAKGGVVGKGDEIVQFANGGKVTSKGNIKPLSNGDNVLATLKTGEIVLNESQQRRIGYSSLKKAQIPNFAQGGLVGAPSTLITNANNSIANEQMRVNLMDEMISATNNRIDRLSVVYTATTDYEVEKGRNDKKTIKANSTF